jgi:hypothetical protein
MPRRSDKLYTYANNDGAKQYRWFTPGSQPLEIEHDGDLYGLEMHGKRVRCSTALYPMWSDNAGINPDKLETALALDQRVGVKAEYDRDGRVKFESPGHRRRYCEAHRLYDRNGGYRDPQRK